VVQNMQSGCIKGSLFFQSKETASCVDPETSLEMLEWGFEIFNCGTAVAEQVEFELLVLLLSTCGIKLLFPMQIKMKR